ncbi:hypothetical protein BJ912DRAFT_929169 [Pholiota molesta]|nr:hypothetical protein BJ912DRAFT_929169 [Pholiota molesta]
MDIVKFHAFHDTNTNPGTTRGGVAAPRHRRAFDSSRRTEPDRRPSVSSRRTVLRSSRANNKRSTRRTDASAARADGDAVSDGGRGGRGGRQARTKVVGLVLTLALSIDHPAKLQHHIDAMKIKVKSTALLFKFSGRILYHRQHLRQLEETISYCIMRFRIFNLDSPKTCLSVVALSVYQSKQQCTQYQSVAGVDGFGEENNHRTSAKRDGHYYYIIT